MTFVRLPVVSGFNVPNVVENLTLPLEIAIVLIILPPVVSARTGSWITCLVVQRCSVQGSSVFERLRIGCRLRLSAATKTCEKHDRQGQ